MSIKENQRKTYSKFENDYQDIRPYSKFDKNQILINLGGGGTDTLKRKLTSSLET